MKKDYLKGQVIKLSPWRVTDPRYTKNEIAKNEFEKNPCNGFQKQ